MATDAAGRHVIADDALAPPAHQGSFWLREHTPLPEAAARAFSTIRQPPAGAATSLNLAGDPARQLVPAGNGLPPAFARALPVNPQAADSIPPTAGSGQGRLLGAGALFLLVAFVIGAFFHQRQAAPQDERPAVEAATPAVAAVPDRALLPPPARAAEPVAVAVPAPVVQSAPSLAAARPADGIEALDELVATHAPARGPARADVARPAPAKGGSAVPPAPRRRAAPLRECPASVATLGLCSPDQQAGE